MFGAKCNYWRLKNEVLLTSPLLKITCQISVTPLSFIGDANLPRILPSMFPGVEQHKLLGEGEGGKKLRLANIQLGRGQN